MAVDRRDTIDPTTAPVLVETGDRDRIAIETAAADRILECRVGEIAGVERDGTE
ncbi:hypothetical protein [Natronorubrum halophilum]|uniref:hypothetical protein n=1 Tax=Natronorubrum halophilum TaxID=1702106 RepID=UPI0013CF291E|nr:hypothetical protein [Natronorubrum halophilum]